MAQQSGYENEERKLLTAMHAHSLPGHTGFITIATLPPFCVRKIEMDLK